MDALPPPPPAAVAFATVEEASRARARVQLRLPNTPVVAATPAVVPGLVRLDLGSQQVAYTDKTGRYYIVGVIFDLDTGQALDHALTGQATAPAERLPR